MTLSRNSSDSKCSTSASAVGSACSAKVEPSSVASMHLHILIPSRQGPDVISSLILDTPAITGQVGLSRNLEILKHPIAL